MHELCRFCGETTEILINLFDNKIVEKITTCLHLKITKEDDLPKNICELCNNKLHDIFQFIDLIVLNEKKWKNELIPKQVSQSLKIVPVANLLARDIIDDGSNLENPQNNKFYKLPNLRIQKINKDGIKATVNNSYNLLLNKMNDTKQPQINNLIQTLQKKSTNLTISKIGKSNEKKQHDDFVKLNDVVLNNESIKIVNNHNLITYDDDLLITRDDELHSIEQNVCIEHIIENNLNENTNNMNINDDENMNDDDDEDYEEEEDDEDDDDDEDDEITENCEKTAKKQLTELSKSLKAKRNVTQSQRQSRVMVVKMESPAAYVCMTCKEKFASFDPLKEHMKNNNKCKLVHLTCEICSKICDNKKALYQHSLSHKEKNTYICDECGKTYSNRFNLENHKSSFHGEQVEEYGSIYKCKVCDKQFTNRKELYSHINSHTKEPTLLLCDSCGKCFSSLETLRSHIRIHLDIRPFGCDHCDKRFRSRLQLQQHLHVHTGIKPFTCEICGKTFAKKGSLISHARLHSGETPYECNFCCAKFSSSSKARTHAKTHQ